MSKTIQISVSISCGPLYCEDCKYLQIQLWRECVLFNTDLQRRNSRYIRCEECLKAERKYDE